MSLRSSLVLFLLVGCGQGTDLDFNNNNGQLQAALALPDVAPAPAANPITPEKVALGRALFWDPILSGGRDVACASCHHPDSAYADSQALSVGVGGTHRTTRNSMGVLDAAFNGLAAANGTADPLAAPMFWDNRARSLEQQAKGPITALDEMRGADFSETAIFPELVKRLTATPSYAAQFSSVFPSRGISEDTIAEAIATFERTLIDTDSSYDRYVKGDATALNATQLRGLDVFQRSGCNGCHTGPMFSDFKLHRIGVPDASGNGGVFRTGSLRNVTRTAPYMHNGALANLDAVFRFYDRVNRRLDPLLNDVRAPDGRDATDLKAFLAAISDGTYDRTVPATVPSGLVPPR